MTPEQLDELQEWVHSQFEALLRTDDSEEFVAGFDDGLWAVVNHIRANYLTR